MSRLCFEIIPDIFHIEQSMKLEEEYGVKFEYNDFMMPHILDQEQECRNRIEFYKKLDRDCSMDTLHGAFLDVTVHSSDAQIRKVSEKRVYQSMQIAEELGVRGVVFHTGLIPNFRTEFYTRQWLEMNVEFWSKVLKDFPQQEIYMENMFDEEAERSIMLGKALESETRFGLCLDYAHVMAFGRCQDAKSWFCQAVPYVKHMHINDNDLKDDLHLAVGDGQIDWTKLKDLLEEYSAETSVLVEVSDYEGQKKSLEYLRNKNLLK